MLKNLFWRMKGIHLFPWKAKITGLWKPKGREGDQTEVLLPLSEDKAGEQQTLSGFLPSEAQQLPAKGHFVFLELYPGFSLVWNSPERLSSLPECLKPWLAHIHAGFPHYTGFYRELNSISSATSRGILKQRYIPTSVEPVLLLSPSLSQNSLHLKHTNSSSSEPQIFF